MRLFLIFLLASVATVTQAADLRLGMIGLDTSHVTAFTALLNETTNKNHIAGARVVAAFKGGSADIESSRSRVDGYTKTLSEKYNVEIVPTIEELCSKVDAVLLESVDGRPHLAQARPVIVAHKPLFIDKPIAGSLRDAIEILRLAKAANVPVFSSSAYRYYESLIALKKVDVGQIKGAISYGPCHLEATHPDLFWYGVHPAEALYTVMGVGCQTVTRISTADTDVVDGVWSDGRVGSFRGIHTGATPHKVILFGSKKVAEQSEGGDDYAPLLREIVKFFQSGIAPVKPEETLELFTFMEAADESKREGGKPVKLSDVLKKNGG